MTQWPSRELTASDAASCKGIDPAARRTRALRTEHGVSQHHRTLRDQRREVLLRASSSSMRLKDKQFSTVPGGGSLVATEGSHWWERDRGAAWAMAEFWIWILAVATRCATWRNDPSRGLKVAHFPT
ncbi:Hypothetical predicted protein [Marmota monax]|uniref:Uncharacterized protein n=1 Tax=Marmota monax TaxID=9995 RepID=A0A5E4A9U8_MARMO|nr:Hypothetical predicted protein [Marmota monax]